MKKITSALLIVLISSSLALAESTKEKSKEKWSNVTQEERKQMSEAHQKMAECLDSNKPMSECHQLMMSNSMKFKSKGMMMGKAWKGDCQYEKE